MLPFKQAPVLMSKVSSAGHLTPTTFYTKGIKMPTSSSGGKIKNSAKGLRAVKTFCVLQWRIHVTILLLQPEDCSTKDEP